MLHQVNARIDFFGHLARQNLLQCRSSSLMTLSCIIIWVMPVQGKAQYICQYIIRASPITLVIRARRSASVPQVVTALERNGRTACLIPTSCVFASCSLLGAKLYNNLPLEISIHKNSSKARLDY